MSIAKGLTARLRSLVRPRAADARMDEELAFHVEMETKRLIDEEHCAASEARRRALIALGGVERHREAMRDGRPARLLAEVIQDTAYALRALRRAPGFTAIAILVIALGIGATTSLFSILNALLLRPLPVAEPTALYTVQEERSGSVSIGPEGRHIPYTRYESYRAASTDLFSGLAAYRFRTVSLRTDAGALAIQGAIASANYFDVLGVDPVLGRFFENDNDPVVVLSHRFWRAEFNESRDIIGRSIHIDGRLYTVAGVAAERFGGTFNGIGVAVWLPFRAHASVNAARVADWVGMFGRLRNPVDSARVRAAVDALAKRIPSDEAHTKVERAYVTPLTGLPEGARRNLRTFLLMMLGAATLVLLIASANIAGMLLARGIARGREMAVRLSLGAGRWRLVRQLLTESLVLFLLAATAGVGLAYVATALLARVNIPGVPLVLDLSLDLRVLAFALTAAGTTGLLFGLTPALRSTRTDLVTALKGGTASGRTRARVRSTFVGAQVAFAVVLLVTAGLFMRGLHRGLAVDYGFAADNVVVGSLDLSARGYDEPAGRAFFDQILRRLSAVPGVESVALSNIVLLTSNVSSNEVTVGDIIAQPAQAIVDTGYFHTMRMQLVAGRTFSGDDRAGDPLAVIVNETLARKLWNVANPIGRTLKRSDDEYQVIGVVRDGRYVHLNEEPRAFAFYPAAQQYSGRMTLHVRTRAGTAQMVEQMRRAVRAVDPDVAVEQAMPLTARIGITLFPQRFAAVLTGVFGLLGLFLGAAGVYGVVSFQVAQRMREFGIRIALGAASRDLVHLVVAHGIVTTSIGVVVGLAFAAAVTRFLRSMLFGLSPLDPITFSAVGVILLVVALLASYAPARRALRADPIVSLRAE